MAKWTPNTIYTYIHTQIYISILSLAYTLFIWSPVSAFESNHCFHFSKYSLVFICLLSSLFLECWLSLICLWLPNNSESDLLWILVLTTSSLPFLHPTQINELSSVFPWVIHIFVCYFNHMFSSPFACELLLLNFKFPEPN